MLEAVIGLVGVIVGSLLTGASEHWRASISRRKNGEFLAIRVVSILDRFIEGCTDVVGDDGLSYGQRDANGCLAIQITPPEFEVQSLDVDWKSIPAMLMYEILSFPNLVDAANHRISGTFEYTAGPPDYEEGFEERQLQYAEIGLKAMNLADQLRGIYGIPVQEYGDWNPVEYFKEKKVRVVEVREKRKEHIAQITNKRQPES